MGMNRRNALIGMGTIAAGGGALFATGAFSQVEADRTVTVETTGDSGALLQLADGGSALVDTEDVDGDSILQINETNLNQNALTRANGAIDVTNGGDNDVGFYVDDTPGNLGDGELLDFRSGGGSIVGTDGSIDIASSGNASIDVVIDLRGDSSVAGDIPTEVAFVADTGQFDGS